jgi:outer membrane lipoprotein-sorting protein
MKARQQCNILLIAALASPAVAQDAHKYLRHSAQTYKELRSLQVEAEAERIVDGAKGSSVKVLITLYSSAPNKVRVETKDSARILQSLLISNGTSTIEYQPTKKQFTRLFPDSLPLSFTPARGVGWGEMIYDTIDEGVSKASIRGEQVVTVGKDRIPCIVIDADYGVSAARYTFWIAPGSGLVLRRIATVWSKGKAQTIISTVRALTVNEAIPDDVFEFHAPNGASEIPL